MVFCDLLKCTNDVEMCVTCGHTENFNLLKTKRRQLYLKAQSVPRSKHFSSGL